MKTLCFLFMWILSLVNAVGPVIPDGESVIIEDVIRFIDISDHGPWTGIPLVITEDGDGLKISTENWNRANAILVCRYLGYDTTNPGVLQEVLITRGMAVLDGTGTEDRITECGATFSLPSFAPRRLYVAAVDCADQPVDDDDDLSPYAIALIVIGCVILIVLLIVLIVLVVYCCKKSQSRSKTAPADMPPVVTATPTSTTPGGTSSAKPTPETSSPEKAPPVNTPPSSTAAAKTQPAKTIKKASAPEKATPAKKTPGNSPRKESP